MLRATSSSVSRWPTWDRRRRRSGRASAAWRSCPISRDAYIGPYVQHQLARIYLLVGEPEKALDQLEPLLKIPYYLSPGWLKIDPNFDPLRGNPRFRAAGGGHVITEARDRAGVARALHSAPSPPIEGHV